MLFYSKNKKMDYNKFNQANDFNSLKNVLWGIIQETRRSIENKEKQVNLLIQSMKEENESLITKSKYYYLI